MTVFLIGMQVLTFNAIQPFPEENGGSTAEGDSEHFERIESEKTEAQILAAERSLKTNLILGLLFFGMFGIVITTSNHLRPYLAVSIFSLMKVVMPIFTTIANFGTIQFVASQYWQFYCNKKCMESFRRRLRALTAT
jgi:hypothetical protein